MRDDLIKTYLFTSGRLLSNMFTAIIGAESDKQVTLSLSRALKRSGQIIIDNHCTVMQNKSSHDPVKQTKILTDYVNKHSTTSLLLVSSAALCSQFATDGTISLQISGSNVTMNARSLKDSISEDMKRKIILVTFSPISTFIPECLQGCECLGLTDSHPEVEISEISLTKLLSALKRRNKELGIHQS